MKFVFLKRSRRDKHHDWQAKWIWCDGIHRTHNIYIYARKKFSLPAAPSTAILKITADSRYKLFVNGRYIGRGPVPSLPSCYSYDIYDIVQHLQAGENVVAVIVHYVGERTYSYIPGRPALICEMDTEWEGGKDKIISDETWRVLPAEAWSATGTRISPRLGFQEVYETALAPQGWTKPSYSDENWQQAAVIGEPPMKPFVKLIPRRIPYLAEDTACPKSVVAVYDAPALPHKTTPRNMAQFMSRENLTKLEMGSIEGAERILNQRRAAAKVKVPQSGGVSIILDFGRIVSGSMELKLTSAGAGIVDIGYSEKLEDGRVKPDRENLRYTDRVIFAAGRHTWRGFQQRGFRFVQLDFRSCPKPVSINKFIVRESVYPAEQIGQFKTNDRRLNEIWDMAIRTAKLSMQDIMMDTVWRERAQWWDAASVVSRAAYYGFGDSALLAQGLRHIAESQKDSGALPALAPSGSDDQFPDFGALWINSLWQYYTQTADTALLEELYPHAVSWLRWAEKFLDDDGLLNNIEGDLFIDWAKIDRRGEVTAMNCLYAMALDAAARIAETIGLHKESDNWSDAAASIRAAVARKLWSSERGLYADARVNRVLKEHFSLQTNILAVLADAADYYRKSAIYRQITNGNNLPPITTTYFAGLAVQALFEGGAAEEALGMIKKEWGSMLDAGASSFWEFTDGSGALCHGCGSAPAYLLPAYVLGVKHLGRKIKIEPHPAGLKHAKGIVPTFAGAAAVEWKAGSGRFTMEIDLPDGLEASVAMPSLFESARLTVDGIEVPDGEIEISPGKHLLVAEKRRLKKHEPRIKHAKREVTTVPAQKEPLRADLESVDLMINLLSEIEKEKTSGRHSRSKSRHSKTSKDEITVKWRTKKEEPAETESQATEQTAKPEQKRGRGRKKSAQTDDKKSETQGLTVDADEPKKKTGRRSRKKSSQTTGQTPAAADSNGEETRKTRRRRKKQTEPT